MAEEKELPKGLSDSVLTGTLGSMFKPGGRDEEDGEGQEAGDVIARGITPLIAYFASISTNVHAISRHIGEQILVLKDMQEDSKRQQETAERAVEEAATEDATAVAPQEQQADARRESDEGEEGEEEEKDQEKKSLLKKFGGLDFDGIVSSFGEMIGSAVIDLGMNLIIRIFPHTAIAALVATIGYGVYKYFTDAEFQKQVDDTFASVKKFVVEDVFGPFIDGISNLVDGVLNWLGDFWKSVKDIASNAMNWAVNKYDEAANYAAEKYEAAKETVKGWFGVSTAKAPAPKPARAAGSATPPTPPKPAAPPTPTASAAPSAPPAESSSAPSKPATQVPAPTAPVVATPAPPPASGPAAVPAPAPTGGAASGDASKLEQVTSKAAGVDLSGIVPAMKARLAGFAEEFNKLTGKKFMITSGWRSPEKQRALYAADPVHAARPGSSPHEVGTAVDMNSKSGDLDQAEALGLFSKYGLFRPLWPPHRTAGVLEAWHIEPIERKKLATMGDGGIIAGKGGGVDPSSGKQVPVPPQPKSGSALSGASTTNAEINENRAKCAGQKTIVVNASTTTINNNKLSPIIANAPAEPIVRAFN